jgi:hypothetical protein
VTPFFSAITGNFDAAAHQSVDDQHRVIEVLKKIPIVFCGAAASLRGLLFDGALLFLQLRR